MQPGRKFKESLRSLTQIDDVLRADAWLALRQFRDAAERFNQSEGQDNGEEAEFYAKAFIRAFLGYADGLGHALRQFALENAKDAGITIPIKRLAELKELKYDTKTDSILNEEHLLSTEASIKLGVTWFAKVNGSDFVLDTSGEGWRGFKRLVKVRNNFTHPKTIEHLFAHLAFAAIRPTFIWFLTQMRDLFGDISTRNGIPVHRPEDPPLEDAYKESQHPFSSNFSEQDLSAVQDVFSRSIKYLELMLKKSFADVQRSLTLMISSSPPFSPGHQHATRTAIRTLFSAVETRTSAAMFFITAAEKRGEIQLSDDDKTFLNSANIEDKLAAALTVFSREFGNAVKLQTTGPLWKDFRGARFARDRLTHPKDLTSLRVDRQIVNTFLNAARYFNDTSAALLIDRHKVASKAGFLEELVAEQKKSQDESTSSDDGEADSGDQV